MSWKKNFQDAITSTAFQLSLSRNMVLVLADVACASKEHGISAGHCYAAGIYRDIWFPALNALKRRGLVDSVPGGVLPNIAITEAGRCVFALCQIAGLLPSAEDIKTEAEKAA